MGDRVPLVGVGSSVHSRTLIVMSLAQRHSPCTSKESRQHRGSEHKHFPVGMHHDEKGSRNRNLV